MGADLPLVAVGLSHATAPVGVRELLALDESGVRDHLGRLTKEGLCSEALLLSTCNRVELYAVAATGEEPLREYFQEFRSGGESVDRYLYWHRGRQAVRHLFRVASSLESMVVGEPQILGQVRSAVLLAQELGTLGGPLGKLAQRSLWLGKRVRATTDVGKSRVGVGNAGVDLAVQIFGDLTGKRALLLGAGEMGCQVGRALLSSGVNELLIANRTHARAQETAETYGGTAVSWDRFAEYLPRVDVVITASGARRPLIDVPMIKKALRARRYRPLFLVDLAVPRNIEPAIDELEEAYLFNIDDLTKVISQGRAARAQASDAAGAMVEQEADRFMLRLSQVDVNPQLGRIARQMEQLRQEELGRSARALETLDDAQKKAVEAMTRALVKKMLHRPLSNIRQAAQEGRSEELTCLLRAFVEEEDPS